MKKTISIILSFLLIFSTIVMGFTTVSAEAVANYFENPENWSLNENTGTNIGSYEGAIQNSTTDWQVITSNTDANYTNNSDASVKIAARNTIAAIMLPDIKKGYKYTVSFDYFTTGDLTNNSAFAMYGIFAPEAEGASIAYARNQLPAGFLAYKHTSNSVADYMPITGTKGQWCTVEMTFNSGDNEKLALLLQTLNGANSVYVDNITVAESDYFETPANWSLNTNAGTNIGSYEGAVHPDATGWQQVTENTDVNYTNNSAASVKIAARNTVAAIMLPDIKKGYKYTVSFDYFTTGDLTNNSAFAMCGIFAPETTNANINWGGNGYLVYKAPATAYTTTDGLFANKVNISENASAGAAKGTWCSMTLEFNSGDFETLALALMPHNGGNLVYVDNIKVIEFDYFENPENWSLNENNGTNIGSYEGAIQNSTTDWQEITSNTDVTYTNNSDASVKIAARNTIAAIMLPDIKKGYKYTVSFDYFTTGDLTNNSAFAMYGIFAPETEGASIAYARNQLPVGFLAYKHTSNSVADYMPITGTKGQWCTVEMTINSGDNEKLALLLQTLNGANLVYVDNIKVVEIDYFEDVDNWSLNQNTGTNIGSYEGAVHPDATGWQQVTSNADAAYTNNSEYSVKIAARNTVAAIMLPDIKKGYKYTVSFDYLTTGDLTNNSAFAMCGIFAPETTNANINWGGNGYLVYKAPATAYTTTDGLFDNKVNISENASQGAAKGTWCSMTLEFNSGNFETLALALMPHNGGNLVYVDNIEVVENGIPDGAEIKDIVGFYGNSIRATGNQALRYKFSVSNDLIDNGYEGYSVEKIGFLATLTSRLEGQELTKEGTYTFAEALAYDAESGTNIIFAKTDTETIYTTALFNIGYNTVTGRTNYNYYGKEYTVRPYMVLNNGVDTITVYGAAQTATVFDVMQAILNENTNEDDVNAVNTVLENEEILAKYNAYIEAQ